MKNFRREIISILLAVLLLVAALFTTVNFTASVYNEIKQKQGEKQEKEFNYRKQKEIYEKIQRLISSSKDYDSLRENISLYLPSEPEISRVIYQFNGLALISGVKLKSVESRELAISPSGSSLAAGRGAIRFNLRVIGSYESFKTFLQKLENNARIFSINSINIEQSEEGPNLFSFSMEIDAYYQI